MSSIPYLTAENFDATVRDDGRPVVVDFTAGWCPPCRAVAPVLDEIAAERDDLRIVKVDVDAQPELAGRFGIMSMPTFVVLRDGVERGRVLGAAPKRHLLAQLEPALTT